MTNLLDTPDDLDEAEDTDRTDPVYALVDDRNKGRVYDAVYGPPLHIAIVDAIAVALARPGRRIIAFEVPVDDEPGRKAADRIAEAQRLALAVALEDHRWTADIELLTRVATTADGRKVRVFSVRVTDGTPTPEV